MGTSGFIRGLYKFSVWLIRFVTLNVLWLIFNIPLLYLTLNLIASKTSDHLLTNAITIAVLSPFVFFPATTAMFGIARQWIIGKHEISIFKFFWKYYRENYVRSLFGGLIAIPLLAILIFDYVYFRQTQSPLIYIFLFVGVFLYVCLMHFFSNTVHVKLNFSTTLRNSFLLSVGSPLHTIGILSSSFIVIFISISYFSSLIFLGTGSLIAFCSFYLYYQSYQKHLDESK